MNADAKICDGCSANFAEGDNCYGISSIEDSALGGFKPDGGKQLCEGCMENLLEEFKQCHRKCFDSWGAGYDSYDEYK